MSFKNATKTKRIKKIGAVIIRSLSIAFFAVTLLILMAAIFLTVSDRRNTAIFGFSLFVVVTDSMEPRIRVGELIVVRSVSNPANLEIDDVITFWQNNKIITHAIIEVQEGRVVARGEKAEDDQIEIDYYDSIIGRVIAQSMPLGAVVLFFTSWHGLVFLIIIPVIALVLHETWRFKAKLKNMKKAKQEQASEELKMKDNL